MVKAGEKLPAFTFNYLDAKGGIQELSTEDLTKGKKVVIISIPGAFTPVCTKEHVPGYLLNYEKIKAKGVDTVAITAVNDPFVLSAYSKSFEADEKIQMLPDGNGGFVKALDLALDLTSMQCGVRGQRFAMLVEDGVITKLEVEPNLGVSCSGADNIMDIL